MISAFAAGQEAISCEEKFFRSRKRRIRALPLVDHGISYGEPPARLNDSANEVSPTIFRQSTDDSSPSVWEKPISSGIHSSNRLPKQRAFHSLALYNRKRINQSKARRRVWRCITPSRTSEGKGLTASSNARIESMILEKRVNQAMRTLIVPER